MTVVPGRKGTAGIEDVPDPDMQDGALMVRGMAVGICGTDREIAGGAYGTPPSGEARLVIGHESLGEVLEARRDQAWCPAVWSSGSCVAPIRCRVPRVPPESGTCAVSTASASAASSACTGTEANIGGWSPTCRAHPPTAGRVRRPARAGVSAGQGVRPDGLELTARILPAGPGAGHRHRPDRA
jgi:hypothetical protein